MRALLRHGDLIWRPGGTPGVYVCRVADAGKARNLAAEFGREPWAGTVTSHNEYLTVTATRDALAQVAVDVARAGPDCVTSGALRGRTMPAAARADLAGAPDWGRARAALAAELTANLAEAAGATMTLTERRSRTGPGTTVRYDLNKGVAAAIAFAGEPAVRFSLARAKPHGPPPDPEIIARHVLANPAYAVRYAHAAAVAVLRWAGTSPGPTRGQPHGVFHPRQLAEPRELALLDALSWLPERVATAARRGRPDEFARYLEALASRTIDTMSSTGYTAGAATTSERLWLADAARAGLAAGLGLLGIAAPDRI